MYAQEIGRIDALPNGADDTRPGSSSPIPGRNERRCAATPIGPMPGPPPPWGIANVLCRFKWQTSAPIEAGLVSPTCAFMFAPSMYTCPPFSCTMLQMVLMSSSNTPWVDGYVIISDD